MEARRAETGSGRTEELQCRRTRGGVVGLASGGRGLRQRRGRVIFVSFSSYFRRTATPPRSCVVTPRTAAPTVHPLACWGHHRRGSCKDQRHPPSVLLQDGVGYHCRRGSRQGKMRSPPLCVPRAHSKKWRLARSRQLQAWASYHRRAPASSRSEPSTPELAVPATPTARLPACWGPPHHRTHRASACRLGSVAVVTCHTRVAPGRSRHCSFHTGVTHSKGGEREREER
jgi:hypothetical protein